MGTRNIEGLKLRKGQCKTCPFKRENQEMLSVERWGDIYKYLLKGVNHICHSTDKHVCRGGRDWQLNVWCSMGIISGPTDAALFEAMRKEGVEPVVKVEEDLESC